MCQKYTKFYTSCKTNKKVVEVYTGVEAVYLLTQRHERSRQGRMLAIAARRILQMKKQYAEPKKVIRERANIYNVMALVIQKMWNKYRERRKVKYRRVQEGLLIGIYKPSWHDGRQTSHHFRAIHRASDRHRKKARSKEEEQAKKKKICSHTSTIC